jgi:hypothetical protein
MGRRLKPILLLILGFVLGTVAGIEWQRYETNRLPPYSYPSPHLRHIYDELGLSQEQDRQMDAIFKKAHARATQINEEVSWDLTEVHHDSLTAIQAILTPEQRIRFEGIRHRLRDQHSRHLHPVEPAMPGGA